MKGLRQPYRNKVSSSDDVLLVWNLLLFINNNNLKNNNYYSSISRQFHVACIYFKMFHVDSGTIFFSIFFNRKVYLTVVLRGCAGYELIYITKVAVGRVGYYQLISGKSEKNNCFSKFSSNSLDFFG